MACEMLLQLNAIRVLLEACSDKQRVDTPYTRDQVSGSEGSRHRACSHKDRGQEARAKVLEERETTWNASTQSIL